MEYACSRDSRLSNLRNLYFVDNNGLSRNGRLNVKKALSIGIIAIAAFTLSSCKSDPACIFAEDTVGCLVITDNMNKE